MSEGNNSAYNNSTISNRNQQAAIHSPQQPFNQPSTNFQFTRNSVPDYAHASVSQPTHLRSSNLPQRNDYSRDY